MPVNTSGLASTLTDRRGDGKPAAAAGVPPQRRPSASETMVATIMAWAIDVPRPQFPADATETAITSASTNSTASPSATSPSGTDSRRSGALGQPAAGLPGQASTDFRFERHPSRALPVSHPAERMPAECHPQ